jgi:GNAT superfamily N-acetyltransferase
MHDVDALARALEFHRRIDERMSTEVVPFEGGVAYLDLEFSRRYTVNFLRIENPEVAPAEHWMREADRLLGGRGMPHRTVSISDPEIAERMAFAFAEHGYALDRGVLMVQESDPERQHDLTQIEEVTYEEGRPLFEEIVRRETWGSDEETVQMFADYRGKLASRIGARFFVARVEGRSAGCCELYVEGDEAMVESVDTLEEFRGRGLASALVLRAAEEGRTMGAEWVHLWADADDWPRLWYERLGFRGSASVLDFLRWPDRYTAPKSPA